LFGNYFALFWHPFMTLVFIALLGYFVWRSPALDYAYEQVGQHP
jgi:hypothetical protein